MISGSVCKKSCKPQATSCKSGIINDLWLVACGLQLFKQLVIQNEAFVSARGALVYFAGARVPDNAYMRSFLYLCASIYGNLLPTGLFYG